MPGCWQQCAPHSLFGLAKKRMGRARSKRKKRFGGSVRASAYLRPPAGDGWPFHVAALIKRGALGETSGPGRSRIPRLSLSAGAGLAVCQASRWRWPVERRGPTSASAPTERRRESVERTPRPSPRRGGCPHPPVSSPHHPPVKAQADLEDPSFRQPPRDFCQTGTRGGRAKRMPKPGVSRQKTTLS